MAQFLALNKWWCYIALKISSVEFPIYFFSFWLRYVFSSATSSASRQRQPPFLKAFRLRGADESWAVVVEMGADFWVTL